MSHHILSHSLFTNHLTICYNTVWATDSIIKVSQKHIVTQGPLKKDNTLLHTTFTSTVTAQPTSLPLTLETGAAMYTKMLEHQNTTLLNAKGWNYASDTV